MLRIMFLTAAVITVPLGAYLLNFRHEPGQITNVTLVSAIQPEVSSPAPAPKPVAILNQDDPDDSGFDLQVETAKKDTLRVLTSGVLAGLNGAAQKTDIKQNARVATEMPDSKDTNYRSLTQSVLANLAAGNSKAAEKSSQVRDLQNLINRSLREGQPDKYVDALLSEYVDALVNEAAYNGTVSVPLELITPEGRVDTEALLATLVEQSDLAAGGGYVSMLNATGASFNKSKSSPLGKDQFHIVAAGDSLAAISYRYYGRTAAYIRIFDANKDKLSSANSIQVGQKLVIPAI